MSQKTRDPVKILKGSIATLNSAELLQFSMDGPHTNWKLSVDFTRQISHIPRCTRP